MLNVYRQLAVLDQLYKIYDQFVDSLDIVCEKFCADCCTCNVTMTTLEAYKIISALDFDSRQTMMDKLNQQMMKNSREGLEKPSKITNVPQMTND